jgi:hypothetical protein
MTLHNHGFPDSQYRIKNGCKGPKKQLLVDKRYLAKRFETFQRCSELIRDAVNYKFGAEKEPNRVAVPFDIFQTESGKFAGA